MARLVDNWRKRDRHRGRDRHRFMDKPLVSVDSEATTDHYTPCDGATCTLACQHRLIMVTVAHEDGRHWTLHGKNLGTKTIFNWLFDLPIENANWLFYAGMYDVDMWLGDVPFKRTLRRISEEVPTRWDAYRITHVRHHTTNLTLFDKADQKVKSITIWDTIGFFQQTFVKTLQDWKIGDAETVRRIEDMKLQRSTFREEQRDEIASYNVSECQLLIQVVRRLITLCQRHGILLTRLDGAGAAAAALLRAYKVEQYLQNPADIEDIARWALYGGRIDISRAGPFRDVWSYDINSAYPAACVSMPCWTHGLWRPSETTSRPLPLGIYRVSWDFSGKLRVMCPLPFRRIDGGIRYPASGQGHYWSMELNELTPQQWEHVTVLDGWSFVQGCEHMPFGFIPDLYAERRKLKAVGDLGHLVIKLPLNALYGKLAQATSGYGKRPRYQSFVAAGYVTSWCRARIMQALTGEDGALAIATDGILVRHRLNLDVGSDLGTWEETHYDRAFIVQPGVYALWEGDERQDKTRGANRSEFDFARLVTHWRTQLRDGLTGQDLFDALTYDYRESRFFGLKVALMRNDFPWRHWLSVERRVSPGSSRHISVGYVRNGRCTIRFYSPVNGEGDVNPDDHTSVWAKLSSGTRMMSQRYEPKREATWTEAELLHHYMPDPSGSDYRIFDR